jgi:hypothetical protein
MDYQVQFDSPGAYSVWVRLAGVANDDSVHVGLDGKIASTGGWGMSSGNSSSFIWTNDVQSGGASVELLVFEPGLRTINVWMREDGVYVDKIILAPSGYTPSGTGPAESPQAPAMDGVTIEGLGDMTATGDSGTITSIQSVSTSNLITGTTTLVDQNGSFVGSNADNFSLDSNASVLYGGEVKTMFSQPVSKIFFFECGGNDFGTIELLGLTGNVIGSEISLSSSTWESTGYDTSFYSIEAQGIMIDLSALSADLPVFGLRFTGSDIDPVSISAVA